MDALIDKTYKKDGTKNEKKQEIRSDDVKKYGDVALKMANSNKKGWNALMLSELIDGKFLIPEYILDAMCFVAKDALLEQRNYFKLGDEVEFFGPNLETFTYKVEEIIDEDGNNIDIVRHPKQVVKMRVDTKLNPNDMMRIKNVLTK